MALAQNVVPTGSAAKNDGANLEQSVSPMSPPVTAASTPRPLDYDRLVADIPFLPKPLAKIVTIIVRGTESMHPSSSDMLGMEGGLRWWKVLEPGRGALYYECAQMCFMWPPYYSAAPETVKEMLDFIGAADENDDALQAAVRKYSLFGTYQKERDERALARNRKDWVAAPIQAEAAPLKRRYNDREDLNDQSSHSQTDSPPRRVSRVKRRRRIVESDESSSEATDPQPQAKPKSLKKAPKQRMPGELIPGKKYYHWPPARLRVFRDIKGLADKDLPVSALGGPQHELESICTSSAVDLRLCNLDMSVEEILTYFPRHTVWREVLWRIMQHWPAVDIVEFIYWTRSLSGEKTVMRATIQKEFREVRTWAVKKLGEQKLAQKDVEGTKAVFKGSTVEGPKTMANMAKMNLDSGNTGCDKGEPFDYYVHDLAEGVQDDHHPTGKGAQLLTHVIEHVREVGDHDLLLSGVVEYAQQHDIVVPVGDQLTGGVDVEDKAARNRHKKTVADSYIAKFGHHPR
ncbi:hypothetical protein HBI70_209780 [Parastagonospora nodorum]|nr:hypothetical protein HBH50_090920 [Parastagonospora nodorum]KAH4081338.1 hypothetical protein HBH46_226690 [Parastagonospora nodorum]KAH4092814.1 hypothetical protein HBH48_072470 [Parastagonospora nodorum]KAH4413706.1 hypothetical protein HBH92_096880 [Parastagonospora nodorum]KAH4417330.1 hypothetical protein HBH93_209370 [Parastagonospora nodorum]